MSGVNYGAKIGKLGFAIGLIMGALHVKGKNGIENSYTSAEVGHQLLYRLKHHYQQAAGHGRSNAAHFKRMRRKRRNIAKHPHSTY
jgi:hypothetical protein